MEEFYSQSQNVKWINNKTNFGIAIISLILIFLIMNFSSSLVSGLIIVALAILILLLGIYNRALRIVYVSINKDSISIFNSKLILLEDTSKSALRYSWSYSYRRVSLRFYGEIKFKDIKKVQKVQKEELGEIKIEVPFDSLIPNESNAVELTLKNFILERDGFLKGSTYINSKIERTEFKNYKLYVSVENPDKFIELVKKKIKK
jgi:hypothetical protein